MKKPNYLKQIAVELRLLRAMFEKLVVSAEKAEQSSRGRRKGYREKPDVIDDPLYEEARKVAVQRDAISTAYLQRKLGIGYARAAKLMDYLEQDRIIGPARGALPRRVIRKMTPEMKSVLANLEAQLKNKPKEGK